MDPLLTPLTRRVLAVLVTLTIGQFLADQWLHWPVERVLAWWPLSSENFRPWQPLSSMLLTGGSPFATLLGWVMLGFLMPPVEAVLGRRGLINAMATSWLVACLAAMLLSVTGAVAVGQPFMGLNPFLTALLVLFGLSRPDATILLFFVIPVRAAWLAWGSGLLALLSLLQLRSLDTALWLGGWIGGYVALQLGGGGPRTLWLKLRRAWLTRRLRVIQGEAPPRTPWGRHDDDVVH